MPDKQTPNLTDKAQAARRARAERQAEALRANLRRRKDRADPAAGEPHKDEPRRG